MCTLKASVTPTHPTGLLKLQTQLLHPRCMFLGTVCVPQGFFNLNNPVGGRWSRPASSGWGVVSTCAKASFLVQEGRPGQMDLAACSWSRAL